MVWIIKQEPKLADLLADLSERKLAEISSIQAFD
jgi:hypothetical protein